MFFFNKNNNENKEIINNILKEVVKALSYSYFSASYSELSAYKTENRVDSISQEVNSLAASSQEMSATIEQTASSIQMANSDQQRVDHSVNEGRTALDQATDHLKESERSISELSSVIRSLEERVNRISESVEVITEINSQTHLLALNASIEAARAGDLGRGFAVVALEIRKLSDRTKISASDIKDSVKSLHDEMQNTIKVMEHSLISVSRGIESTVNIKVPFDRVEESAMTISDILAQLSGAAEEQAAVTTEIAANASNIAETTEFADDIARDAEQHSKLSREVAIHSWNAIKKNFDLKDLGLVAFLAERVIDHALWIDKLMSAIKGQSADNQNLADHHGCQLGKWYYGEGRDAIQNYSAEAQKLFGAIEEPHRRVHQHGINALKNHREGNKDAAFDEIVLLTRASEEIITLFVKLMNAVSTQS